MKKIVVETLSELIGLVSGLGPGEIILVKYKDATITFEGGEKNQIISQRNLRLIDLGIDAKEEDIIVELYFYNHSNCFIEEIPAKFFRANKIRIEIKEDNKTYIFKKSENFNEDINRGYLNHLVQISNHCFIGIITHEEPKEVSIITMADLFKNYIF